VLALREDGISPAGSSGSDFLGFLLHKFELHATPAMPNILMGCLPKKWIMGRVKKIGRFF
jgi:hypothetical protein